MSDLEIKYAIKGEPTHSKITEVGGDNWKSSVAEVIRSIKNGTKRYYTSDGNTRTTIEVVKGKRAEYIRTHKDGRPGDNLLTLSAGPDIDQANPSTLDPGATIFLNGNRFGPPQGKVLLEVRSGTVVELVVEQWTDTSIVAHVDPILEDLPLRTYYGKLWLITGAGQTSNVWNIEYKPRYVEYAAWSVTKTCRGYGGGNHEDGVFLKDCRFGDPDFQIIRVDRHHSGDGWSELRSPTAKGQSLAQGYHIGVDWFGEARMSLLYAAWGPKGIRPPHFDGLGDWTPLT